MHQIEVQAGVLRVVGGNALVLAVHQHRGHVGLPGQLDAVGGLAVRSQNACNIITAVVAVGQLGAAAVDGDAAEFPTAVPAIPDPHDIVAVGHIQI